MDKIIENEYPNYDWSVDFEELPDNIEDVKFLTECRYKYEEYYMKLNNKEECRKGIQLRRIICK